MTVRRLATDMVAYWVAGSHWAALLKQNSSGSAACRSSIGRDTSVASGIGPANRTGTNLGGANMPSLPSRT
jgi:hypothetical protein